MTPVYIMAPFLVGSPFSNRSVGLIGIGWFVVHVQIILYTFRLYTLYSQYNINCSWYFSSFWISRSWFDGVTDLLQIVVLQIRVDSLFHRFELVCCNMNTLVVITSFVRFSMDRLCSWLRPPSAGIVRRKCWRSLCQRMIWEQCRRTFGVALCPRRFHCHLLQYLSTGSD